MKNQMTRNKRFIVFILTAVLAIALSSCSPVNEDYSQELQNQVSALQTQNALNKKRGAAMSASRSFYSLAYRLSSRYGFRWQKFWSWRLQ